MAWLTLLRDASNISGDMLARVVGSGGGSLSNIYDAPTAPGIGTGFTVGVVGKMNGAAGADPNHFSVQATGTNLVLTIRAGWAWVRRDTGTASLDPRCLYVANNATSTVTLASNSQGSTRVDTIALRIDMSTAPDATGSNLPNIVIVQGGASSAVGNAPADGALYVPLANVTILNTATNVAQSAVADKRYVHPSQAVVRAYLTAAQTFATTGSVVNLDTKKFDPSGTFDTTNHRWVIPLPGKYIMLGNSKVAPATAGRLWIQASGANASVGTDAFTNGTFSGAVLAAEDSFSYGDFMSITAAASGAGAAAQNDGPGQSNFLSAMWVCF